MKIHPLYSVNNHSYNYKSKEANVPNTFVKYSAQELTGVPRAYISFGNLEKMNREMIGEFLKYIDIADDFYNEENPIYKKRANEKINRLRNERNGWNIKNIKYWFGKVGKTEEAEIFEEEYNKYLKEKELYDKFRKNEAYYRSLIGSEEIEIYNKTKKILQDKFTLSKVIAGYNSQKDELHKLLIEPIQKENILSTKEKITPSILLYGPTGCGKSSIAKYISNEINCNVIPFSETTLRKFVGQLKSHLDDARENYFAQKEINDNILKSPEYINADIDEKAKIKAGLKSPRTIIVIDEIDKYFKDDGKQYSSDIVDMNKTFLKGILDNCSKTPQKDVTSDAVAVTILFTTNHPSLIDTEISLRSGKCERMLINFPTENDIREITKFYIDTYANSKIKEANNNGKNINYINADLIDNMTSFNFALPNNIKGAHTGSSLKNAVEILANNYLSTQNITPREVMNALGKSKGRVNPEKIKEFQNEILQMGLLNKEIDEKEEYELLSELKNLDMLKDTQKLRLDYLINIYEKNDKV